MFTEKSLKTLVENALSLEKKFQKNNDTFTGYTAENEKVNVHFLRTEIQVFKGTFLVERFKLATEKDFKDAEKKAKEIIKKIKSLSK